MCPLPQWAGFQETTAEPALGAYGLRLAGLAGCEQLLVPAEQSWPQIEIGVTISPDTAAPIELLDGQKALVRLRTAGWIEMDRASGRAAYFVQEPLSDDEIVHPYLAPAAIVVSHWHERESIHGGAFAVDGTAWGLVGDRFGGKSSLLAALATRGVQVLADDLLVLDELTAFAGPRTIDLREDAASELGLGESLGRIGARERWRLRLAVVQASVRIGGWVFVCWGDRTEIQRLRGADALQRLLGSRGIHAAPKDPAHLLRLSALPAWELRRPRSWASLSQTVEDLLSTVVG
jgi:hypothetical protein